MTDRLADIADAITRDGFAYVHAPEMRAVLQKAALRDWDGFARSWGDLGVDTYMADGGRYRRRRFAAFRAAGSENGGLERWFEPVTDAIGSHPAMQAILSTCKYLFDRLTPASVRPNAWHVEIHQFRIEARPGQEGRPTPEGMHRDGVDWVLVLLVSRVNVQSGETSIHDLAKQPLGSFTLTEPLDAAFTDDNRVFHGVTPIEPLDSAQPGHRDVLVVTFRRE